MTAAGRAIVRGEPAHDDRYAPEDDGPNPAEQVRAVLVEQRAEGESFGDAWPTALRRIQWPASKVEARSWSIVLGTRLVRSAFADAYKGHPSSAGARAVARLGSIDAEDDSRPVRAGA